MDDLAHNDCAAGAVPTGQFFVGPRIDFAYAEEGLPPEGLPIWWESYRDGAPPRHYDPSTRFQRAASDLVIFLKGNSTFIPSSVGFSLASDRYRHLEQDVLDGYARPAGAAWLQDAG